MILVEKLLSFDKTKPEEIAGALSDEEIEALVGLLSLKEDELRYRAFLLLQSRSRMSRDVYRYWDLFRSKTIDINSYQRSIGMMLLAENARWDTEGKAGDSLGDMTSLLSDEKPITVRQTIQSLETVGLSVTALREPIRQALIDLDLDRVRESMRKLILTDILYALIKLTDATESQAVGAYIVRAMTGDVLDAKTKKTLQRLRDEEMQKFGKQYHNNSL
jgi:hypothetical protein